VDYLEDLQVAHWRKVRQPKPTMRGGEFLIS